MALNLLSMMIIGIVSLFSFFMGIYSIAKFISVYRKGGDLFKARGYLINAFILIFVVPPLMILIGVKIADFVQPIPLVGVSVSSTGYPSGERISIPGDIKITEKDNSFDLTINNNFDEEEKFTIELSCIDEPEKCEKGYNILLAEDKEITIEPKMNIKLPITINFKDVPKDDYLYQIKVKTADNNTYDYVDIRISVE